MEESEIFITPQSVDDATSCHPVWEVVRHVVKALGHKRFPGYVRDAVSVAEQPGRISLRNQPGETHTQKCGTLTIISANLWHDFPRHTKLEERLDSFASLVEDEHADIVLLQEVARTATFKADTWLASRLKMAYVYSRANGSAKIGFEEGLGIFSRYPFACLPYLRQVGKRDNPFVRRLALGVDITTPCGEILAFSVHLALPREQNAVQLRELHQWVSTMSMGRCAVIGGDFNAPEHTHQIRHIRAFWEDTYRTVHPHGDAVTHEIRWPWGAALVSHRLDYVFVQPGHPAWDVAEVHHLDSPAGPHSDHRAVLVRLTPAHP